MNYHPHSAHDEHSDEKRLHIWHNVRSLLLSLCALTLAFFGAALGIGLYFGLPPSMENRINALYSEEWKHRLDMDPIFASNIGESGNFSARLPSMSNTTIFQEYAWYKQFFDRNQYWLEKAQDEFSGKNLTSIMIFEQILISKIKSYQYKEYLMNLDQFDGLHLSIREIVPHKLTTLHQYESYLERLQQVPKLIKEQIDLLKMGMDQGYTKPSNAYSEVPSQILSLIQGTIENNTLYHPFTHFPRSIPEYNRTLLRLEAKEAVKDIIEGFEHLMKFVQYEFKPRTSINVLDLPNGALYYEYLVTFYTSTNRTPLEYHTLGLSQVTMSLAAVEQVVRQIGWNGTYKEYVSHLRSDPQYYPTNIVTVIRDIAKQTDPLMPEYFEKLSSCPYGVDIGKFDTNNPRYYSKPSFDCKRPGMYYLNEADQYSHNVIFIEALTLRHTVPGYHILSSMHVEDLDLPNFRYHLEFPVFYYGWGAYSESLGIEMEYYTDLHQKLGFLQLELFRSCQLVVDTGIHLKRWNRDQAIAYFSERVALSISEIARHVDFISAYPGQVLSAKIGSLKILELRRKAEMEMKDHFELSKFHHAVISGGQVPLSVLEKQIELFIHEADQTRETPH